MSLERGQFLAGIDIGAGGGTKVGLFDHRRRCRGVSLLPVGRYGAAADAFGDAVASTVLGLLRERRLDPSALVAAGAACPGIFARDGRLRVVANLRFLEGVSLKELLSPRLGGVPVGWINDADAGGLALWERERRELLYWVFGGGWGGVWISARGQVRFPSVGWEKDDDLLHYTKEPGYAIPLGKEMLDGLFRTVGGSWPRFEAVCVEELDPKDGVLRGPNGNPDCVRAELLLSGPGRWRLFRSLLPKRNALRRVLAPEDLAALQCSAAAGPVIDRLAAGREETALRTDRLFGLALAEAADALYHQALAAGCPPGIPAFIGGKVSRALHLFGPPARERMRAKGVRIRLRLSSFERRRVSANLAGTALVAQHALDAET
jgi:hypothetical protein